jgi:hypothetical protein
MLCLIILTFKHEKVFGYFEKEYMIYRKKNIQNKHTKKQKNNKNRKKKIRKKQKIFIKVEYL